MMAGRRVRDRLVPMPHPRFVRVLLAGAAILLAVTPGRAQGPAPAAPSTSPPGTADTPVPGRVRVSRIDFTGVSPSVLSELRTTLSMRASSRWPWGRKVYFSRAGLADDLRRIEAYYDRARVRRRPRRHLRRRDAVARKRRRLRFTSSRGRRSTSPRSRPSASRSCRTSVRARVLKRARADAGRRPDPRRRRPRARAGPHRAPGRGLSVRARRDPRGRGRRTARKSC